LSSALLYSYSISVNASFAGSVTGTNAFLRDLEVRVVRLLLLWSDLWSDLSLLAGSDSSIIATGLLSRIASYTGVLNLSLLDDVFGALDSFIRRSRIPPPTIQTLKKDKNKKKTQRAGALFSRF
jgi:hypothetical protein